MMTPKPSREELEVQLTALLLGELDAAEADRLRQTLATDAELARLHDQLKQTLGLVRAAAADLAAPGAAAGESEPLRLSEDRREALSAQFKTYPVTGLPASRSRAMPWYVPAGIAAVLMLFVGVVGLFPDFATRRLKGSSTLAELPLPEPRLVEPMRRMETLSMNLPLGEESELSPVRSYTAVPYQASSVAEPSDVVDTPEDAIALGTGVLRKGTVMTEGDYTTQSYGRYGGVAGGSTSGLDTDGETGLRDTVEGWNKGEITDLSDGAEVLYDSAFESAPARGVTADFFAYGTSPVASPAKRPAPAATTASATPPSLQAGREENETVDAATGQSLLRSREQTLNVWGGLAFGDLPKVAAERLTRAAPESSSREDSADRREIAENKLSVGKPVQEAETLWALTAPSPSPGRARGQSATDLGAVLQKDAQEDLPVQSRRHYRIALPGGEATLETGQPLPAGGDRYFFARTLGEDQVKGGASVFGFTPAIRRPEGAARPAELSAGAMVSGRLGSPAMPQWADDAVGQSTRKARRSEVERDKAARADDSQGIPSGTVAPGAGYKPQPVPAGTPVPPAPVQQAEVRTDANRFSTFSLNVSDVSFKLAAANLENGQLPDVATVRSEEFLNAFDYRDPAPAPGQALALAWERARSPFAHNRDLLRFSVQTAARGREPNRPLNLVLLLDNSGSMERADRVSIIRECLNVLAGQLTPQDRVSVVTFARTARLWVDGVPGVQAGASLATAGQLTPEGGTNLEEAMSLAYATARRHYLAEGVNRVVVLTDGAANLGTVDPESLKAGVEAHRREGIALDCFGIGWEGYNDDLLEVLSRNGDGRYGFVNTPDDASREFAAQLAGALQVAAADVKVQVEFNPDRVTAYRQIGYAKHQLTKEQFRDNSVDAAEIGAAESGSALYVIEVNPQGQGAVATVRARFKVPATGDYRESEWTVPYTGQAPALDQAGEAMRLAASASAFSEWLVNSPYAGDVSPDGLLNILQGVPEFFGADPRPRKLEWMIREAGRLAGSD